MTVAEDREKWRQRKDVKNPLYSRRLLMKMIGTANVPICWTSYAVLRQERPTVLL